MHRRRRMRTRTDRRLIGAAAFLGALYLLAQAEPADLLASLLTWVGSVPLAHWISTALAASVLLLACAFLMLSGRLLAAWHALANLTAEKRERPLLSAWVIDGDTIDDRATGVRYRLANIDAPETGENAKCYRERWQGDLATRAAIALVRRAREVTVRRTWRKDRYGRRVAFVLVDGVDLGEVLIERGFARRWRGRRERWCGPDGGLAKMARLRRARFECGTCRDWRRN